MVFYEILITKGNPIGGNISFQNEGDNYVATNSFSFAEANAFMFQVFPASTVGFLLGFNTTTEETFSWIKNGIEGPTAFPPLISDPFLIGDCIHITNGTVAGFPATLIIRDNSSIVVQTLVLNQGEDTWLLWNGNDSRFSNQPCCVHPDTKVLTKNGSVKISEIKKGDIIMGYDKESKNKVGNEIDSGISGREVEVISNIRCVPSKDFIEIPIASLGNNQPREKLLIRAGHPILVNGKEIDPKKLLNKKLNISKKKLEKPVSVWTICTKERDFVYMNGVPVCTWNYEDWKQHAEKKTIVYTEF